MARSVAVSEVTKGASWRGAAGSAAGAAPADLAQALTLLADGDVEVDDLVTHTLPLDEIVTGFGLVADADESVKVIIEP